MRHIICCDYIAFLGTYLFSLELIIISFYLYAYFSVHLSKINPLSSSRNVNLSIHSNLWSTTFLYFLGDARPEALCTLASTGICCSLGFLQSCGAQTTFTIINNNMDSFFISNVMDPIFWIWCPPLSFAFPYFRTSYFAVASYKRYMGGKFLNSSVWKYLYSVLRLYW